MVHEEKCYHSNTFVDDDRERCADCGESWPLEDDHWENEGGWVPKNDTPKRKRNR